MRSPAAAITQVRFGGDELRDLYLTAVPADGGDSLKAGIVPTEPASILYRGRAPVAGLAIARSDFQLR